VRAVLRATSARLVVGHLDPAEADALLEVVEPRGRPTVFALAEPEGLASLALVPAGAAAASGGGDALRLGKLVLETAANEYQGTHREEPCDALVDGLRLAHRHLGRGGLDLVPRGGSGVGFCGAAITQDAVQLVIVPPGQAFILHQGTVHAVPETHELGRGIWSRDDLRAEVFAGIGGLHEPDIRVYDAAVGPGDTVVLLSSALARMLSEDDVSRACAYEEAAVAASNLRQLALQRGVEGALAVVVEVSASLLDQSDADALGDGSGASGEAAQERLSPFPAPPAGALEMPPLTAVFSTARQRVLELLERLQPGNSERGGAHLVAGALLDDEDVDDTGVVPWPHRSGPTGRAGAVHGEYGRDEQPSAGQAMRGEVAPATDEDAEQDGEATARMSDNARDAGGDADLTGAGALSRPANLVDIAPAARGLKPLARGTGAALGRQRGGAAGAWLAQVVMLGRSARARLAVRPGRQSRGRPGVAQAPDTRPRRSPFGSARLPEAQGLARRAGGQLRQAGGVLLQLPASRQQRRTLLLPALLAAVVLAILLIAVRQLHSQQRQQLNQRYQSLISAAQQVETQARGNANHTLALAEIHQAQALLDQAGTLQHDQTSAKALRATLTSDENKLSNIVALPAATLVAAVDPAAATSAGAGGMALTGDGSALYVLDRTQQKVVQVMRVQKSSAAVVSQGQAAGSAKMGAPELESEATDGSLIVVDSAHNAWQYVPNKNDLIALNLKGVNAWKSAQDVASYGGNIYVLDAALGNIWRYVPTNGAYTGAPSRFFATDRPAQLDSAISMAIDGSIWLLGSDGQVLKLTGGQAQAVALTGLPHPLANPVALFTTLDTHSLYVLDNGGSRVIQLDKNGAYQRELDLGLPKPASSIYVDEGSRALYAVSGGSVYSWSLPL